MEVYMQLNEQQQKAFDAAHRGKNIFISGLSGSGKSYTVMKIRHSLTFTHFKKVGITSTTGISAINVKGKTLHSYLGIGLGKYSVKNLFKMITSTDKIKNKWVNLDVLIIDEVSMLSVELFKKLEELARLIRKNENPFGGIQLILVGDFAQLPVVGEDKLLFQSPLWNKCIDETIYLTEIIRQKDPLFCRILNKIRVAEIDDEVRKVLESCVREFTGEIKPIMLHSINALVDKANKAFYEKLPGPEYTYDISFEWYKNCNKDKYIKLVRFPLELELKENAQVMYLVNNDNLVNGSCGIVKRFEDGYPVVLFDNDKEKLVTEEVLSIEEEDEVIMTYKQLPLKLAFAASIHKSQGCTFSSAIIDMKNIFDHGQAYVALSRVQSLDGLYIKNLDFNVIKAHPIAKAFYKQLEEKK